MDRITTTEGLAATAAECAEGRTAPRVTLDAINAAIAAQYIFTADKALVGLDPPVPVAAGLDRLTMCLIVMQNGFIIVGKSAPASAANFDSELGAKLAYEDAVRQIWPLMGFALRDQLFHVEQTAGDRLVEEAGPEAGFHPAFPTAQIAMPEGFKEYVGVKRVFAQPMTRGDYNRLRSSDVPADEDPADDGYLLEYTDGGKPNVDGFEGYISWSPKDVFDRAYNPSD